MSLINGNLIGKFQKAVNELLIDGDCENTINKIKPGHMIYVKLYDAENDRYNILNFSTSYAGTPMILSSHQLLNVLGLTK